MNFLSKVFCRVDLKRMPSPRCRMGASWLGSLLVAKHRREGHTVYQKRLEGCEVLFPGHLRAQTR